MMTAEQAREAYRRELDAHGKRLQDIEAQCRAIAALGDREGDWERIDRRLAFEVDISNRLQELAEQHFGHKASR